MINIPKSEVNAGDTFYVGIYCEKKCKYELLAKLENEFQIFEGAMYQAYIEKEASIAFKIQSRPDFDEMEIVAFAQGLGNFRMYVGKNEMPSNQKTILAIPSWIGGYTANIVKGSQDYCTSCFYYIVLEAPIESAHIFFFVKYDETVTTVRSTEPVFSTLRPYKTHCYKTYVDDSNKKENLIIQTTLFSGSVTLKTRPWKSPSDNQNTSDINEYIIHSEKVIKISPQDRKLNTNTETGDFYFCLSTYEFASYLVKAYFESEVEDTQRFNLLVRGKEIDGYLPKGKALRYRILEFENKSNLTVSMTVKSGDPKLYGYICENIRQCHFTREKVAQEILSNKIIYSLENSLGYVLRIDDSVNTCHKKIAADDSQRNNMNSIRCAALAVVVCEGSQECEYSLRTTRDDVKMILTPRRPHYQVIPYNDKDYYIINIQDKSISHLNVVLNSITGDADMSVTYLDPLTKQEKLIALSENEPYLPDVIRIKKEKLGEGKSDITGTYYVTVYGSSFSSYSIYYYTQTDASKPATPTFDPSRVSSELLTGHIIKDFIEDDAKYKIYAYNPRMGDESQDIRITLTPERSSYGIYVFFNPNEIVFNDTNLYDSIKNSQWSSLYYNELIIKKTDPNFKKGATYYIVIARQSGYNTNSNTRTTHTPSYWLGVTNEFYPFLIYEGVPQTSKLDNSYETQSYWYTHSNITNPFSLSINVFYGRVSVYADFQEIRGDVNSTSFDSQSLALKEIDIDTEYLTISPETLKTRCKGNNNCGIYILVKKSSPSDAQYLLVAKSHPSQPEILNSGVVRSDTMYPGEVRNFNIVFDKKENSVVFVTFLSGYGEVYLNAPKKILSSKKAIYPTQEKFDYKAEDYYLGKIISLSSKAFGECNPCQALVSVYGRNLGYAEDDIEFSISYYDEVRKLNQNQPLRGHITQGELQYFSVYFSKSENVYVSLTNMDGDVDLFMNYGNNLPVFDNSTWSSSTPYNEFIEFNKDDNYFVTNKINEIQGNYTLMLYGYTNSSYTLYVTTHPKKILPIDTFSPASCKAKAGDYCYFRYDDFDELEYNKTMDYEFVITTDYLYGSGIIYASLYNATDYDILSDFPSYQNNDFNTVTSNSRNLLKMKINNKNPKLSKESMLLITVECKENCFFDLNMVRKFDSDIQYLDLNRENVFYINKNNQDQKTVLVFYNWNDKDLSYGIGAYEGKADFKVYTNETDYLGDSNNSTGSSGTQVTPQYKIKEINSFSVDYNSGEGYFNKIKSKENGIAYKSLYFSVLPKTDFGFFVKISYDAEWTKVKIGKVNTYVLNSFGKFYGYFDMMDDYDYSILSVQTENPNVMVYAYIRYAYINKNEKAKKDTSNPYGYSIPDNVNAEITGNTDPVLNSVSIKIPKPQVDSTQNPGKFIRVLFSLETMDLSLSRNVTDVKINLLISPSTQGMSKIQAEPSKYIFAQFQGINTDIKIYDLKRRLPEDDLLVLEMSSCLGDFDYKITDKMNFHSRDVQSIDHFEDISGGRKLIKVDLKKYNSDNFYLTLKAKESGGKDCYSVNNKYYCEDISLAMFYYYTTTQDKFKNSFSNGRGSLQIENVNDNSALIKWNKIMSRAKDQTITQADAIYKVFITDNLFDYNHMESVCYLSRMKQDNSTNLDLSYLESSIEAKISGLTADRRYFVNVLAKNVETNDVIAFQPIEILPKGGSIPGFYICKKNINFYENNFKILF